MVLWVRATRLDWRVGHIPCVQGIRRPAAFHHKDLAQQSSHLIWTWANEYNHFGPNQPKLFEGLSE